MVTRYRPDLIVRVGGVVIAQSAVGSPALLGVESLSVDWGRDTPWDHPDSAQAEFTLRDSSFTYGSNSGPTLTGQAVTFSYAVPGVIAERIFFRGTITEAVMTVLPPDPFTGENRGADFACSAVSIVTQIASVRTGAVSYAAESFQVRWARLANIIRPSLVTSVPFNPAYNAFAMVARSYDRNTNVLDALQALMDITGDRMGYDPHANAFVLLGRRMIDDPAGFAVLSSDPVNAAGLVLKAATQTAVAPLDGDEFSGSGEMTKNLETTLTAVEVQRYTDNTGSAQATGVLFIDSALDAIAPNRLSIATDLWQVADSTSVLNTWVQIMQREGKRWSPDRITHETKKVGGLTAGQIPLLLDCMERNTFVYLSSTQWARAGAAPVFAIIGGTVTYESGHWSPTVQLASVYPAQGNTGNARTPANVDTAVRRVLVSELDESLAAADALFWSAAFTG